MTYGDTMDLRGRENSIVSQWATEDDRFNATIDPYFNAPQKKPQAQSIWQRIEDGIAPNCTRPCSRGFLQGYRGVVFTVFLVGAFSLADKWREGFHKNVRVTTISTEYERGWHGVKADDMESKQKLQVQSNGQQTSRQGLRRSGLQQVEGQYGVIERVQDTALISNDQLPPSSIDAMQSDIEMEKTNVAFEIPHLHGFRGIFEEHDRDNDIPIFWHIPKAGGSTIKDIVGTCHSRVIANENGVMNGHTTDSVSTANCVMHVIIMFRVTQ